MSATNGSTDLCNGAITDLETVTAGSLYLNTASNERWPKAEDEPQSRKSGQQSRKKHTAHRHRQHTVAMGKTTRANVQSQSRKRVARLALLERICQASRTTVRHNIQLPGDLSAGDLAREVEEYREVGWRVSILWRGSWAVMVFLSKHSVLSTSTNHRSLAVLDPRLSKFH